MTLEQRAIRLLERLSDLETAAREFAAADSEGSRKWKRVELARQAVRYTLAVKRARTDRGRT